ncbi:DUF2231 domain-containing protein [Agrococcus baldri]|nr:DUF2231 domain-containing protein [Agrococcus baldri]
MDLLLAGNGFAIAGLPLHPLMVHAVVILVPLTALALVLGSLWPAAQRRLGIVTPLAAALLVVLVPITVSAGEALADIVGETPAVETHEDYAEMLLPWVIGMLVVAAAQWAWFRWGGRRGPDGSSRRARPVTIVLAALALVAAAGATVTVVLIGDSGARAVWGGILG